VNNLKSIKTALVSVYHKDKLDVVVRKLNDLNVKIISTGGTSDFVKSLGVDVYTVEDLTGYPSILGGRVKTLHPKVFGGILARREQQGDKDQLAEYQIPEIDLVIVDLYPFEETVASGAEDKAIIEKIDIGGISLIRAAAKNFNDVLIVSSRTQYEPLMQLLEEKNGQTDLDDRRKYAGEAFNTSSHYDTAIFNYFAKEETSAFKLSYQNGDQLRYGENPHQKGMFFGDFNKVFDKIHGKEISYNNLLDIDAAFSLMSEFNETTFAILKHNNACGIASRNKLIDAWKDALAGDPVSAFGGILITNAKIDEETALEIDKLFFEVVIAPAYDEKALEIIKQKKNRIILVQKTNDLPKVQFKSLLNGVAVQDRDLKTETKENMTVATKLSPSSKEYIDLEFANKLVKNSKSNAIVLAKNKQLLASGIGQTSRVDALRQAIAKADGFGFSLEGAVMASDAFFPFPDCVEIAHNAGITSVVEPGGSVKDKESIDYCNQNNMSMVFTGIRHFKH